ncbi:hypothetical protein ACQR1V_26475 [Bradyrhizobium oligotrophicum]|uniref:hypothetical protein n=1 Tax=Bradyrhizobium oligotrophicum TaxID=44255 RepID=UPI003EBD072D
MADHVAVQNLSAVFSGKVKLPTITLWNRLEGRPRTHDFDRALKAEVRDPLWLLTKQWQMGEFQGDDAGSPVVAKVHIETTELTKYRAAGNPPEAFADDVPLEAKVERRPIPFRLAGQKMAFDLRIALGRRWLKLVAGIEPGLAQQFIAALPLAMPDPALKADAPVAAHREAWQTMAALAGRSMDGYDLVEHLMAAPGNHAHDLVALGNPASTAAIETAEAEFLAWYREAFYQPAAGAADAWLPDRLEYAFAASAPKAGGEKLVVADEYFQGHLDWYNFDVDASGAGLGDLADAPPPAAVETTFTASFIPAPIQFDGMPNTRWWTFEEGRTNFGDIDPETTDVNKLLLIEFGLVYANDWFLMPFTVPAGAITRVAGMSVTNVFGERIWVEAAGKGADEDWQRWSMFTLATKGSDDIPADLSLFVVPSVPKIQEGEPLESVELFRDEMANMVWGVESRVMLASGDSKSGRSAALDTRRYFRRLVEESLPPAPLPAPPIENDAAIRYRLMSEMPENWIPFIPVHIDNDGREIQLRRAALLRVIDRDPDPPVRVEPRTDLLRHGLDLPQQQGYNLHEEEVPRAGIRVTQSFQRTRWYNGRTFVWLGIRKETDRGERSSKLAFDTILPKRKA